MIAFTLPGNPISTNAVYRIVSIGKRGSKHGALMMTKAGKAFKQAIADAAQTAKMDSPAFTGPVAIRVAFWFDSRRPDIDGPLKLVQDAMQGVLYANDRQITQVFLAKYLDRENPRLDVRVWEAT